MDFTNLDLNALPVWLLTIAVVLYLLPRILERFAAFVPPLAALMQSERERRDTALHWKLESNGLRLSNDLKAQERLIDILEQSLERMFDDRAASEANYQAVIEEIRELRHQIQQMGNTLSLHSTTIAKLADEQEQFRERLDQLPERVDSLKAYIEG